MLGAVLWNSCVQFWNYVPLKVVPRFLDHLILLAIETCISETIDIEVDSMSMSETLSFRQILWEKKSSQSERSYTYLYNLCFYIWAFIFLFVIQVFEMIQPRLSDESEVSAFLEGHIQVDLQHLAGCFQRSSEDCMLLLHSVINHMSTCKCW